MQHPICGSCGPIACLPLHADLWSTTPHAGYAHDPAKQAEHDASSYYGTDEQGAYEVSRQTLWAAPYFCGISPASFCVFE